MEVPSTELLVLAAVENRPSVSSATQASVASEVGPESIGTVCSNSASEWTPYSTLALPIPWEPFAVESAVASASMAASTALVAAVVAAKVLQNTMVVLVVLVEPFEIVAPALLD